MRRRPAPPRWRDVALFSVVVFVVTFGLGYAYLAQWDRAMTREALAVPAAEESRGWEDYPAGPENLRVWERIRPVEGWE